MLRHASPKLERLLLNSACRGNALAPDDFVALSRSAQNLQHIKIEYRGINFLGTIVEQFPKLKTLHIFSGGNGDIAGVAPSRRDSSLEEIIFEKFTPAPMSVLYETIKACPNLKRVKLNGAQFTEDQIVVLARSLPHLTHFWFSSQFSSKNDSFDDDDSDDEAVAWGDVPMRMINVFKSYPGFVHLTVKNVVDWGNQRLVDDTDRITVTKISGPGVCSLELVKKLVADPFKNFHKITVG